MNRESHKTGDKTSRTWNPLPIIAGVGASHPAKTLAAMLAIVIAFMISSCKLDC